MRKSLSPCANARQRLIRGLPHMLVGAGAAFGLLWPPRHRPILALRRDPFRPRGEAAAADRGVGLELALGAGRGHVEQVQLLVPLLRLRISPHQFRYLAGYLYLRQYPGGHEGVRALLGHHSIATTTQAYA